MKADDEEPVAGASVTDDADEEDDNDNDDEENNGSADRNGPPFDFGLLIAFTSPLDLSLSLSLSVSLLLSSSPSLSPPRLFLVLRIFVSLHARPVLPPKKYSMHHYVKEN